jgi:hypothetical protein
VDMRFGAAPRLSPAGPESVFAAGERW